MSYGDAAAEQREQDQPASCMRPDGTKPELEPLKDRDDFIRRVQHAALRRTNCQDLRMRAAAAPVDAYEDGTNTGYYDSRIRALEAEMDQLALMRAAQILEEAERRRRDVLTKAAKAKLSQMQVPETPAEITLDEAERRGE